MWKNWPVLALAMLPLLPLPGSGAEPPSPPAVQTAREAARQAGHALSWTNLAAGLDMALLTEPDEGQAPVQVTIVRMEPDLYEFSLHSEAWDGPPARTIRQWAESLNLTAAINAGMYLPDGKTSTGYMRRGEDVNNSRIASRYNGFFVSGPRRAGLPPAAVLDRAVDDCEKLLPAYDIVVQNFRLFGPGGSHLWPRNGPVHAVAAVAQDEDGRILFLHCREAVSVHRFVSALNAHPDLRLRAAIYVEGGGQAAMALRLPGQSAVWAGRSAASLLLGSEDAVITLPNIIGARPRQGLAQSTDTERTAGSP
ncbi:MAG: phosphodiester glycosidase family protein [Desulfovibrionaceae bacterium]|nr:phosphodiester glycosidase family protein [Desulfovibrionaceae bacterium]